MKTAPYLRRLVLSSFAVLLASGAWAQTAPADAPFRNAALPAEARARDLVARMTLEEKVAQVPNHAAAIPRLGVLEYDYWSEALHGLARAGYATVFPQAIGMAATWDRDLIHQEGVTIAREARLKYGQARAAGRPGIYFGLDVWSPNINIFRDPRWGRGQETYGEDPFLTGTLGGAFIRGVQGDDPMHPTAIATPKHYAVHSGPEADRHRFDVPVSPHDLEDTYLPAFRAAIVDAKAQSIMCAYNRILGQPACASDLLLKQKLRGDWHFAGYVTSDCGAIDDIFEGHAFTRDRAAASAVSLQAGTDTACGGTLSEPRAMLEAVHRGLATEAELDRALIRLFAARFRLGMFDAQPPVPQHVRPDAALSLKAAHEAIVLLKNDGVLPLGAAAKRIAVVGPNAVSLAALEGNYNGIIAGPRFLPDANFDSLGVKRTVVYAQGGSLAERFFATVPRTLFRTAVGGVGLDAVYTDEGTGGKTMRRVDPEIDFDWSAASPFTGEMTRPAEAFSVRWTGTIVPPAAGDYTFRIEDSHCYPCEDVEQYTIRIGGKTLVDATMPPAKRHDFAEFTAHFETLTPQPVEIGYRHRSPVFAAGMTLSWLPPAAAMREQALQAAREADVVVAALGLSPNLEGEEMKVDVEGFAGGDRTSIELPRAQRELLESLAATGKPLVVVLMNGSALALDWARQHAAAVVEAWYPGADGAQAIADVLKGAYNPGGRLPVTFYASTADLPAFTDYSMANRTYRYFRGKPTFGFGFGLGYAKFTYSGLKLPPAPLRAGEKLTVGVDVENISAIAGDEVVELYLAPPKNETNPRLMLAGFDRVHLAAHEKRAISIAVEPRTMSLVDGKGIRAVRPGTYRIFAGGAQPEESPGHMEASFTIEGTRAMEP